MEHFQVDDMIIFLCCVEIHEGEVFHMPIQIDHNRTEKRHI